MRLATAINSPTRGASHTTRKLTLPNHGKMSGYSKYTHKSIEEMPDIVKRWPHSKGAVLFEYKGIEVCFGRSDYGDYYYHCWTDSSGNKLKLGIQAHLEECKKEIDSIVSEGIQWRRLSNERMFLTPIPFFN